MPRKYFDNFVGQLVEQGIEQLPLLPLTHGTKALNLRDILDAGSVSLPSSKCAILQDNLIFAFYGRPSYRVSPTGEALGKPASAPCYLLLNPELIGAAEYAHPLDTGAFRKDLYLRHVDVEFDPKDFGFVPSAKSVSAVVRYFYEDNEKYLQNHCITGKNIPAGELEVNAYYGVITDNSGAVALDERSSAIEFALSQEIPIDAHHVNCILMPTEFADDRYYGDRARELGIDVRTYVFTKGFSSNEHISRIFDATTAYYREQGFIR